MHSKPVQAILYFNVSLSIIQIISILSLSSLPLPSKQRTIEVSTLSWKKQKSNFGLAERNWSVKRNIY